MDFWVFVLCAIIISYGSALYREKIRASIKIAKVQSNEDQDDRIAQLEERIETLERIVTDQKTELREKINAL